MAKQLNVNLAFTADTSKAKQQIQDLQNQLTKFLNQPMSGFGDALTKDIKEASRAAAELKVHLEKATNPNTGTLDFSKLNQSMKQANTSISQYAAKIRDMGPEGQKSFMMLAQSVAAAEVPIRRSNALLDEMWTTMKNTMRWQISSSILHGFMGAISSATGYAKDLNESLNNIRIVTGQSVDQMAKFAENANKAAKALSTTTTEYTNAALIYYQQGLSDKDVLARTDITVKMANVAGESAQKVSDQLTAVWNNFYDGSKSLEYYADVMTALGAATASSTDEISEGLNKFAAVAETVGLSYEYAASALATVTATTRQSADIVGTAFKTLFARIQDLELGKTLDDGTSLGKYSAALAAVGVNIKDSNGGLKEMDQILNEMAAKWDTLSKDQQVSLAQTVAGVRQYTQLIALMDNWDFMQENLATSYGSTGALQEQADIYEESWQAASNRVRAALEEIYATLIDDEAFIDILNGVEKIIKGFDTLIDAAGGLKGVIFTLGTILTNVFSKQLSDSITNLGYNLQNLTEEGRAKVQAQKTQEMQNMLDLMYDKDAMGDSLVDKTTRDVLSSQLEDQIRLTEQAKDLSEIEQATLQILLDQKKARGDLAIKAAEEKQAAIEKKSNAWVDARGAGVKTEDLDKIAQRARAAEKIRQKMLQGERFDKDGKNLGVQLKKAESGLEDYILSLGEGQKQARLFAESCRDVEKVNQKSTKAIRDSKQKIDLSTRSTQQNTDAQQKNAQSLKISAQGFVQLASAAMGVFSAVSMLGSAFDSIKNPDLSDWEKFSNIATSLGMTFLTLSNSLNKLSAVQVTSTGNTLGQIAATTKLGKVGKKAFVSLGGAATGAGASVAAILPYLLIIIAALATLTIAVNEIKDAWNKERDNLQAASEAAEQAKQKYDELKNSYDELKKSLQDYVEAQNALKTLTKGTKEWNEALLDSNNKVVELLKAYPKLAAYFNSSGGIYSFTDQDEALKLYEQELAAAKADADLSSITSILAKNANARTQAIRNEDIIDIFNQDDWNKLINTRMVEGGALGTVLGGTIVGTGAGAVSLGTLAAPGYAVGAGLGAGVGTLVGALTGLGEAVVKNQQYAKESEKAYDSLMKAYLENNTAVFSSQTELTKVLETAGVSISDELINNTEGLKALEIQAQSLSNSANQLAAILQGTVNSSNADNELYQSASEEDKRLFDEIISNRVAKAQTDPTGDIWTNAVEKASAEIFGGAFVKDDYSSYLTARFGQNAGSYRVTNTWGDEATLQKLNETTGVWEEMGTLTNKMVSEFMATRNLSQATEEDKQIVESANKLEELLQQSGVSDQSIISQYQSDLIKGSGFSFSLLNEESYNQLKEIINKLPEDSGFGNEIALKLREALSGEFDSEAYQNEIAKYQSEQINAIFEQGSKDLEITAEALESYSERLIENNTDLKENRIEAAKIAVEHYRLAKGINKTKDILEKNSEALQEGNENSLEYHEAIGELSNALEDTFKMDVDPTFIKEHLDDIKKMADGDVEALNRVRLALSEDFILNLELEDENLNNALFSEISRLNELAALNPVGTELKLDNEKAIEALNKALFTGQATIEDIEAMFNNANLQMPEYQTKTIPGDAVHSKSVTTFKGPLGLSYTMTSDTTTTTDRVVPYFGDNAPTVDNDGNVTSYGGGGSFNVTTSGNNQVADDLLEYDGDGGSSGGGSKPKTAKKVNKSDTVDRYKEVNDSIEDLQHNLDISNKKADALWGEARFKEMRKGVKILEEENELLKEKSNLANAYLAEDAATLNKVAGAAGINFTFNADGNISNYTTEMTKLWTQLDNAITSANRDGNVSDSEQERIDKLQEKVDAVKDAISQYEDTLKTKQDIDKEYSDNQQEIWDTNFDILTESLEYNLSFNEADLELIDYYLSKMEDNMFKLAEAYTKLNEKSIEYSDNLDIQRKHYEDLTESFKNGEISEAQYKEALLESQSAIVDTLQSLLDLDKEMQEYYGNTLDKAAEEIDIYADKIDHLNSVLDHYNNIMDLTGKSKDYEAMATILEGQAENLHNQLQIAKEEYDMYKTQAEYWEEMMAAVDETDPAFETYKKNWDAAETATNDAQDEMLSKTQEWAEAMKAVIENELADIGQTLEKSITGGTSFDELLTSMERANSLQEEYLTDTNKIYETNKLIRTAQQEIDKTTNTVAKNKLKQFINETNQLQEQTKLSEYELKIQQAKYDLILAEIALEEAQQAKSTVRLTRDSEGNFGYVYTADQSQIDAAQQKLEDAQNSLYNIGLEGANDYSQKYAETMSEMYDTLQEIQIAFLNGEIATQEEYDRRMLEAKEYYFDKLKDFSNLYQIALTTDSRVINDAWSSDFNGMIYKTEELKTEVNKYAEESAGVLATWAQNVKEAIDGSGLSDINTAVSGIVSDSKKLTEVLSGEDGLISKLNEEINKVKESTSEYALKRVEIQGLISDYENLAKVINADYDDKNITAPETTLPSENAASEPESATGPASNAPLGVGSAVKVKAGTTWYSNSYGGGSSGRARNGTILYVNESGTHPYNIDGLGWVRKEDLESFKTGGYTGAWGSYGKLALLDEKELILNANDTSNFLASMEVLERILSIIDLHSANAQLSGMLFAPGFNHMNEQSIEQNVHIEASFPGVQDRNEIEEAFNNLINQASQYANRK